MTLSSPWRCGWTHRVYLHVYLMILSTLNMRASSNLSSPREESMPLSFHMDAMSTNSTTDLILGHSHDHFGSRLDVNSANAKGKSRRRRGVANLYSMVACTTGCDPLLYKGYGCYCGFLGSGYAVDGIDRCCQLHDWCYDSSGCPVFLEYFVPYYWKCYQSTPYCGIHYGSHGSCGRRLCHCDQMFAQCLQRYPCPVTKAICTSSPWRFFQNVLML